MAVSPDLHLAEPYARHFESSDHGCFPRLVKLGRGHLVNVEHPWTFTLPRAFRPQRS